MAQKAIHVNLAPTDPKNIAAGDDAAILSGIIGSALASSSGILAFGERLKLTKVTNNSVKVATGIYLNQGHAVRVTSDEVLTILSGTQGKQRIDLVVSEYRKGADRDTHVIKILQGALYDADPVAPTLQSENLHGAGTVRQEEIGRIMLNGTTITSVARTAAVVNGLAEVTTSIDRIVSGEIRVGDTNKLDGKNSAAFATSGHNHDSAYLGKTAKAADSAKLDGYEQSGENIPSTIVRRTAYGTVHATVFAEEGITLDNKYLGKTAKAADSAKLDGREVSWEPVAGGIPRWSSPEKAIKADEFREKDVKLENKYISYESQNAAPTYNLNSLVSSGHYYTVGTAFTNGPADYTGKYCMVIVMRRPGSDDCTQFLITVNGLVYVRELNNGVWGTWATMIGALYGTGAPPSNLKPGQIYIQY